LPAPPAASIAIATWRAADAGTSRIASIGLSLDPDAAGRVPHVLLGDDPVDLRGCPPDLAGLVDDELVVILLPRELDRRVALPDLQLLGRLRGACSQPLEELLHPRAGQQKSATPR